MNNLLSLRNAKESKQGVTNPNKQADLFIESFANYKDQLVPGYLMLHVSLFNT